MCNVENDIQIQILIDNERQRQRETIELIASENIVSDDVRAAAGSILTNKYAEGKPFNRYYNGCEFVDQIEALAVSRFQELFKTDYHVNVQPHSGAQANMAVFMSILEPGDTVLSMDLSNGGHLSHGSPVNFSGKYYNIISYGVNEEGCIDYEEVEKLALEHKPKLIICGASNYSKVIDFERFGQIRDNVIKESKSMSDSLDVDLDCSCYLLADIAHIAGLVAGGVHPSPFGTADFVTTTTHKSLRGPRGGVIACKQEYAKKLDSAVFPGMQGGPLEHIIAAKAVCFYEALQPEFKEYAKQVVENAKALCSGLLERNLDVVGGMTENHLMTLDLRKLGLTGKEVTNLLEKIGITANKNTVPNDPQSPFVTSGVRLGVCAVTTRGFKCEDMLEVADIIADAIKYKDNWTILNDIKERSLDLCRKYPLDKYDRI